MRLAFMGTPAFAVGALAEIIAAGHELACVYTQPPSPRGRGQVLQPSPVQAFSETLGIQVRTPPSMRAPDAIRAFQALELEAAVVVAYGQILVSDVLDAPTLGCFNLHASLLPRWRGAAPIQRAIMAGDTVTGAQVMRMEDGLDTGPIVLSHSVAISPADTAATLHDRLAAVGAALLPPALSAIGRGGTVLTPQAAEGVTYARKISVGEARIDWRRPAHEVDCHVRGLSPFPGAWFVLETPRGPTRVKALLSRLEPEMAVHDVVPGQVLDAELAIACGEGAVRLLYLQREGRGPQSVDDFVRGLPVTRGVRLG